MFAVYILFLCARRCESTDHNPLQNKRWVEWPHLFPQICAEEHRLLWDVGISLTEQTVICLSGIKYADHAPGFVNEVAIAIDHSDIRMLLQIFSRRADRARFISII